MKIKFFLISILGLALLAAWPAGAANVVPLTPNPAIVLSEGTALGYPSLAASDSVYGAVWQENAGGNNYEIYFARFDNQGGKLGDKVRVTNDNGLSVHPKIVWNSSYQEFGVVWADSMGGPLTQTEIYYARISEDGSKVSAPVKISNLQNISVTPDLVWTGSRYLVAWRIIPEGPESIYLTRIDRSGNVLDNPSILIRQTPDGRTTSRPVLSWSSFYQKALLAWSDNSAVDTWYDPYYVLIGNVDQVNADVGVARQINAQHSAVNIGQAWGDGRFTIIWSSPVAAIPGLYYIQLDQDGIIVKQETGITTHNRVNSDYAPNLVWDSSKNEFHLLWAEKDAVQPSKSYLYYSHFRPGDVSPLYDGKFKFSEQISNLSTFDLAVLGDYSGFVFASQADSKILFQYWDAVSPQVSNVQVSGVTASSATIAWTTSEAADSQVLFDYAPGGVFRNDETDSNLVTNHSITLTNLIANATVYYKVASQDAAGNLAESAAATFRTLSDDVAPPVISNIQVSDITNSSALVSWATNEASDSRALFDYVPDVFEDGKTDPNLVTSHSITLTNLIANSTVYYKVASQDAAGNLAESAAATFQTLANDNTSPIITHSPAADTSVGQNSAVVSWRTNEDAKGDVEYHKVTIEGRHDIALDNIQIKSNPLGVFSINYNVTLSDLEQVKYAYRILAYDRVWNLSVSPWYEFTVTGQGGGGGGGGGGGDVTPPQISSISASNITQTSVMLSWRTDEGATTEIEWGKTNSYGKSYNDSTKKTSHQAVLSGLESGTLYHYRIKAQDSSGNWSRTQDFTVRTSLPPLPSGVTNGQLVKSSASSAVYWILNNKKHVFPHINVYLSWGLPSNFSTTKTISQTILNQISEGGPVLPRDGFMFRGTRTSLYGKHKTAVFLTSQGQLWDIVSAEVYQTLFNDPKWQRVTWVPDDLLAKFNYPYGGLLTDTSKHAHGTLIKYPNSSSVYIIQNEQRRPFTSGTAFTANRFQWKDIIEVPERETYTTGALVTGPESNFLSPP